MLDRKSWNHRNRVVVTRGGGDREEVDGEREHVDQKVPSLNQTGGLSSGDLSHSPGTTANNNVLYIFK